MRQPRRVVCLTPPEMLALFYILAFCFSIGLVGCELVTSGSAPAAPWQGTDLRGPDSVDGGGQGPVHDAGSGPSLDATADAKDAVDGSTGCAFRGRYALQVTAEVSWGPKLLGGFIPVIEAGTEVMEMTVLLDLRPTAADALEGELSVCDVQVPAFESTQFVGGGEQYAVRFPQEVWDAPSMPSAAVSVEPLCPNAGCAARISPLSVLLGVEMSRPTDPWPADRTQLVYPDHDDDGLPAISLATLGPADGFAYRKPPLDPLLFLRADELMLGVRVNAAFDATFDTCEALSGQSTQFSIDTHVATCTLADLGSECTAEQVTFVDDNLPQWQVRSASFTGWRLQDGADCASAREAF